MDKYVHLGTNDCQGDNKILYEKFVDSSIWWHLYHWLIDILIIKHIYLIRLLTFCFHFVMSETSIICFGRSLGNKFENEFNWCVYRNMRCRNEYATITPSYYTTAICKSASSETWLGYILAFKLALSKILMQQRAFDILCFFVASWLPLSSVVFLMNLRLPREK